MEKSYPQIHIIANCASRKRLPPVAELRAIQKNALEKRAEVWWKKLNEFPKQPASKKIPFRESLTKIKAKDLYIGSYWSTVRRLPDKARLAGFESKLWVLSAGYGLISSNENIHSYSATFTPGDDNSVSNGERDASERAKILRHWWKLISGYSFAENTKPRKLSQLLKAHKNDYFLIIASCDYLTAIEQDLLDGVKFLSSPENFLIITSKSFSNENLKKNLVPADARLQCHRDCSQECDEHLIGRGIRGSIGASLGEKIVEKMTGGEFNSSLLKEFVESQIEKSPELFYLSRNRLTDADVSGFINKELSEMPSASCTSLLRKLRDGGQACEGKRFKELYLETRKTLQ